MTWSTPSPRRSSTVNEDGEPLVEGVELQIAKSKAAMILLRMEPNDITPACRPRNWSVKGIICYSKICTHVGCPISLNERTTHHLLCPCHQSTFDLADHGKVIFGPAGRPLPQLPMGVDDEGYLVALSDFTEPVGPSFWERTYAMSIDTSKVAASNATTPRHGGKPSPAGAAASWADERLGIAVAMKKQIRRSSPTTGRSCSARSRCGASSSCSSPACS